MPTTFITGATGGIGRYIALSLVRLGHDLIFTARSKAASDDLAGWLLGQVPQARLQPRIADLSSLAETRAMAESLVAEGRPLDILINNAGVFLPRRQMTPEGHEYVLATNHLAPYVLTRALLPALLRAKQARIVNTGSSMSDRARIFPDDLEGRRHWGLVHTYGQSKLAMLIVTGLWAERLRGTGVTANTVHPGAVATGLVRAGGVIGLAWRAMRPFLLTEEQGADTPIHVATAPEFAQITGAYVKRRRPVAPNSLALDAALASRVWAATEALTGP